MKEERNKEEPRGSSLFLYLSLVVEQQGGSDMAGKNTRPTQPPVFFNYSKSLITSGMEFKTSLAMTEAVVPKSSAA